MKRAPVRELLALPLRELVRRGTVYCRHCILDAYYAAFHPRFCQIRRTCCGLCLVSVYREIYARTLVLPDYDIVEIGGAAGAGSVSFALALKDSGKKSNVVVVEKCEGGSRNRYGGYAENLQIIQNNFASFNVADKCTLFPHYLTMENRGEAISLIRTEFIAALGCDADGRIDRDFSAFWPKLMPNALIVIDDFPKALQPRSRRRYLRSGRVKHVLTYDLLNKFIEWGLFQPAKRIAETIFGYKPEDANFEKFDSKTCDSIVKSVEAEFHRLKSVP